MKYQSTQHRKIISLTGPQISTLLTSQQHRHNCRNQFRIFYGKFNFSNIFLQLCFYMLHGTYIIISICNLAGSARKFPIQTMPLEFIIINARRTFLILQYGLSQFAYDPSNNLYVPSNMSSSFQFFSQIGGKRSQILKWL